MDGHTAISTLLSGREERRVIKKLIKNKVQIWLKLFSEISWYNQCQTAVSAYSPPITHSSIHLASI
jgi:hypothetical protein